MAKQKVLPFPDSGIYASLRRATPYERVFHAGAWWLFQSRKSRDWNVRGRPRGPAGP